jgi:hypothetical protein
MGCEQHRLVVVVEHVAPRLGPILLILAGQWLKIVSYITPIKYYYLTKKGPEGPF